MCMFDIFNNTKYLKIIQSFYREEHQAAFRNMKPERASRQEFEDTFNLLEWTDTQIEAFQQLTYSNASHNIYCPTVSVTLDKVI